MVRTNVDQTRRQASQEPDTVWHQLRYMRVCRHTVTHIQVTNTLLTKSICSALTQAYDTYRKQSYRVILAWRATVMQQWQNSSACWSSACIRFWDHGL